MAFSIDLFARVLLILKIVNWNGFSKMNDSEALSHLQAAELIILDAIASLCAKFDINWWLDGGTCLGAMRHNGFIPWDDDIDIGMMRSDYERFCELAPKELQPGFSLHNSQNTDCYAAMFSKVYMDGTRFENQEGRDAGSAMGIFVDVFPYDYLYVDANLRSRQIKTASSAQRLSYLYHSGVFLFRIRACLVKSKRQSVFCSMVLKGCVVRILANIRTDLITLLAMITLDKLAMSA